MDESNLKEAFVKVKQDIFALGAELSSVRQEILDLKSEISLLSSYLQDLRISQFQQESQKTVQNNATENVKNELNIKITQKMTEIEEKLAELDRQTPQRTDRQTQNPTFRHINSETPTHIPTHPQEIGGLITQNKPISTGNEGVPTDTPTDRQTDRHTLLSSKERELDRLQNVSSILADLDALKKEVRLKFKRLTNQEMQVFSTLYSLENSSELVDYKLLSSRLGLSESSIRDYILKLERKGIPIIKEKLNNKRIILHISPDLKQVASLSTILQLRDL